MTFTRPGIVTQARTTSTRLPRKVLTEVAGRTLLDHHLDRLAATGLPVVVATTTSSHVEVIDAVLPRDTPYPIELSTVPDPAWSEYDGLHAKLARSQPPAG